MLTKLPGNPSSKRTVSQGFPTLMIVAVLP
jgi:hypothetical protein